MTAHNPDKSAPPPAASAQPADVLRIQVERSHNGHTAQGSVLLHRSAAPDAGQSPHTKLAGTRAWLALGEQRLAAGDAPAAVACAQAGIQELGKRYAAHTVVDDTGMKIRAAEEQLQKGRTQDAAAVMLRMLGTRTKLYAKLHAGAIAE